MRNGVWGRRPRRVEGGALALLLLLFASPAAAEKREPQTEAARAAETDAARTEIATARAARRERRRLAAEQVEAAKQLRAAEQQTSELALRMDALARAKQAAQAALDARAADMAPLLPVIERLSLYPAETMLAVPAAPEDALRGVLVLRGIGRELERQAEALRAQQAALDRLTEQMARASPALDAAQDAQRARGVELDEQIAASEADRRAVEETANASARAAADTAAKAETLKAVIADVERGRRAEEARARADAARADKQRHDAEADAARERAAAAARPAGPDTLASTAGPRGQLTAPVAGRVARAWGEPTDAGPASGVSYFAPPDARVVSPCAGRVVFAAPFRGYGPMLIVDCGGGYHAVLAGLARLDATAGRTVLEGEPLGVMPGWDPKQAASRRPALYVELRRDGAPINPAPWLRASG